VKKKRKEKENKNEKENKIESTVHDLDIEGLGFLIDHFLGRPV